jgi:peptide/nickel transport system substrate-binding protein
MTRRSIATLAAALLLAFAAGPAAAQETPRMGGVLKAAMIGEPPTLDMHWTTAVLTQQIMWHVYETLYTYDKSFAPVPMLAEGHTISPDGKKYTIALRKGVKFHNGKELTAADAIASLNHWARTSTIGKPLWKNVESTEAKDSHTLVINLKEPSGSLLYGLGRPNAGAAIYPKEVADAAGDQQIKEYIGTGPYRFVEHKPDRHIKLARFKDYAARSEAADGYGGKRVAYFDEIHFLPVPDVAVRVAGSETGEYHFAQQIKQDQYDRLKSVAAIDARIVKPAGWVAAVFNFKEGLMTSKKLRQAVQAALDMEPAMGAAVGNKEFYRLDPALYFPEQPQWHTTVGSALYNQKDKEKARRLLKEASYTGQPVKWLTTKEYEQLYKTSLVAKQQLEDIGLVIDLQVVDWATLVQRRQKPDTFDMYSTFFVFTADPALHTSVQCNYPGWWCTEDKERALADLARESDPKKRRALVERVQAVFYEDVGRIKFGDYFVLDVTRKDVRGFRSTPDLFFWNAWLAK